MNSFSKIFKTKKPIIGMIHLAALPGSPAYGGSPQAILDLALSEAELYHKAGISALLMENMHDTPYLKREATPEQVSLMGIIAYRVKQATRLPCGIQILAGANEAALGVALAAGLDFIRAEGFVYGHLADEGYMDADAATLLRYRKNIGAEHIAIFTDIKKKHSSHAITADVSLAETARTAAFCRSDGLIVTGTATGAAARPTDVAEVRAASDLPIIIGSGVTIDNVEAYRSADGWIVGSHFKRNGHWSEGVDYERVASFVDVVNKLG